MTRKALIGGAFGPALGVSTADFDGDGWMDIYVGNDGMANQLWINQRNGTFKDTALIAGAAVNASGDAEASMGIDAGDFDNDGDEDLLASRPARADEHLVHERRRRRVRGPQRPLGPGPAEPGQDRLRHCWFDYDNDGWLDLRP